MEATEREIKDYIFMLFMMVDLLIEIHKTLLEFPFLGDDYELIFE